MQRGFSLIEMLCALGITTVIVTMGCFGIGSVLKTITALQTNQEHLIRRTFIHDVLRRDLWSAKSDPASWDADSGFFIRQTLTKNGVAQERTVRWFVDHGKLKRYAGEYDYTAKRWGNKSARIMDRAIAAITFALQADTSGVRRVCVRLTDKDKKESSEIVVSLRNRVLS